MIADVIRHAETEHEIYSLLSAYLEAIQFENKNSYYSNTATILPLAGKNDLEQRVNQLFIELDSASKALDDHACLTMKEALHIFGSALHQLQHLELLENPNNDSSPRNRHIPKSVGHEKIMQTRSWLTHSHMEPKETDRFSTNHNTAQ